MAIRGFYYGLQAVAGVAPTTYIFLPIVSGSFKPDNQQKRETVKRVTGTRWADQGTRRSTREFKATFQMYLDFDMNCYPLTSHFGAPATVAVPSAAGAFTNTFKPGGSTIVPAGIQWRALSGGVTRWKQAIDCKVTQVKLSLSATGLQMVDYTIIGKYGATITAPGSPPALVFANYTQPDISMDALSLGGASYLKVKKLDLTSDQGLTNDWDISGSLDPTRVKIGDAGAKISVTRFLEDYPTSLIAYSEGATGRLPQLIATVQGLDAIGTGTPTTPQVLLTVPKPDTISAKENETNDDDEETVELELAYDTTMATGYSLMFRNELAASAFVGS